jgi:sugar (pentulose or hexulose) kinase
VLTEPQYVLAIDPGTSACKVAIVPTGSIHAVCATAQWSGTVAVDAGGRPLRDPIIESHRHVARRHHVVNGHRHVANR